MKIILRLFLAVIFTFAVAVSAQAVPEDKSVENKAPAFELLAHDGSIQSLESFKGKFVVLEWFNRDCPFVKKHYNSGNMQALQKEYTEKGVVWLSVVSSAPEKQGYLTEETALETIQDYNSFPTYVLFDPEGTVGRLYGARTTPHMFVIDPLGEIAYAGAIDDKPSADKADVEGATNYVRAALESLMSGNKVEVTMTQPYGCSVKYGEKS